MVVAYTPPEDGGRALLPAEAGALVDERFDPQDLTASMVDLAVKGYLSIAEERTEGILFDRIDYLPSPIDIPPVKGEKENGEPDLRPAGDEQPFAGLAFKIMTDPYVGQLAFIRVSYNFV